MGQGRDEKNGAGVEGLNPGVEGWNPPVLTHRGGRQASA